MSDYKLRNCSWGYSCKANWDELTTTGSESIRFCGDCQKEVYRVESKVSLAEAVLLNRCVCFPSSLISIEKPVTRLMGVVPGPLLDSDPDSPF